MINSFDLLKVSIFVLIFLMSTKSIYFHTRKRVSIVSFFSKLKDLGKKITVTIVIVLN